LDNQAPLLAAWFLRGFPGEKIDNKFLIYIELSRQVSRPLSPPDSISHCFNTFETVVLQRFLCFIVFQQIARCFTKRFSIVSGLRKCFSKVKNETSSEKSVFNTIFSVKSGLFLPNLGPRNSNPETHEN